MKRACLSTTLAGVVALVGLSGMRLAGAPAPPAIENALAQGHFEDLLFEQQPADAAVFAGQNAHFTVQVRSPLDSCVTYQWFFNNVPISLKENDTATGNELQIKGVGPANVGEYFCQVTRDTPQLGLALGRRSDVPPISCRSQPVTLNLLTRGSIIVCGLPVVGSGGPGSGGCPPAYKSYFNIKKSSPPVGYFLDDIGRPGTVTCTTGNPVIRYWTVGNALANGCSPTPGTLQIPAGNTNAFTFTAYFTNTVTTTNSFTLDNFR
jgi:hypothetical protein